MKKPPSPAYAELQVTTNFSFLRGGSHPEEMVMRAAELGQAAIAVTDRNSLAGVVRAHSAAKRLRAEGRPVRLLVGTRLDLVEGHSLLCLPRNRAAYSRLSQLLTRGKRRAKKGGCHLHLADLADCAEDQIAIALPPESPTPSEDHWAGFAAFLEQLALLYGDDAFLAVHRLYRGDDAERLDRLVTLANRCETPPVATNDVHYHVPERRPLQDVLTCIREHCTLEEAGFRLFANDERHLKPPAEMARLFADHPDAVARTVEIADRIDFSLDELRYIYPADPIPEGRTPQQELERLAWKGAGWRYPRGMPAKVADTIRTELELIGTLDYAPYFLTVHDIIRFADSEGILFQGRGSAANSAVCYCLGITAVAPDMVDLLFARFISAERGEPPDIDVDFEHERREEVIQYIYAKYGRDRAGLAATVITYRARSAMREVGKVLGLSEDTTATLARTVWGWSRDGVQEHHIREVGLDPDDPTLRLAVLLATELNGFPRHLSQHVGGFVITDGPLADLVPIENAAMAERTVVEWDKDDLDALGILKIDVLGLGMLSCIRRSFDLVQRHYGRTLDLATVPTDDAQTYEMLCKGDSIGVFQVESRAQMSMLPRLRPRCYYDLVIQVAIVRPGPIQGDMVHPYLRRRSGEETVDYPSPELRKVLSKTLGVPLFQEQAMSIAIVAAGFTDSEADQLRRAMAAFRKTGKVYGFRDKMIEGMVGNGYSRDFAERCFRQIEGFGEYGFPESHAASFALLVYVSAWIKCHYPAAFACALLNSQPMGFYAPAQIVRDAREHGVEVLPVDINRSAWDHTLEPGSDGAMALRLGFRQVKGLRAGDMEELVRRRGNGYSDPRHLWRRSGLHPRIVERLARADAFAPLGLERREALWAAKILGPEPLPLFAAADEDEQAGDPPVTLPAMTAGEQVVEDYSALRLTLRAHPLALMREDMDERGVLPNGLLVETPSDARIAVAGLVLIRQRPGTAKGVVFLTIEDDTGVANIIVWPHVLEKYRAVVMGARLVHVTGRLQREGIVTHIVADRLADLSPLLDGLGMRDRPGEDAFAGILSPADESRREPRDPRAGHRDPRRDGARKRMYPSRDFH